ncbi:hypothetical protein BDZ91DRAFT_802749 [Kalaharituber pfeilii]|nr:hypothetical protein BDZ91DRAFT_802749 [Kalaharituber pfeilii]
MSFENQELNSNMDLLDLDTLFNDLPMLLGQVPGLWEADVGGKAVSSTGTADQADPASSISHKGEDDLTQDSEAETSQDLDELFYEDDERKSMGNDAELGEAVSAQEAPAAAAANSCAPAGTVNPAAGVPGTQSTPSAPGAMDPRKTVYTSLLHPTQPGPAQLTQWIRLPTLPSLGSAETAGSAHVAGPSAPTASTAARREPSPFLPSHPSPGQPAPVTEQSAAPSPSTRSVKKGPTAKTPRPGPEPTRAHTQNVPLYDNDKLMLRPRPVVNRPRVDTTTKRGLHALLSHRALLLLPHPRPSSPSAATSAITLLLLEFDHPILWTHVDIHFLCTT